MHPYHKHLGVRGMHPPIHLPEITIDESTPQAFRVFHAMRNVMRAQKQLMMSRLAEKDAHLGQAFTLWTLTEHEGMNPSELANILGVKRPTVTIMLRKMEKAGLVERRADEHDQRFTRVYLTDAGRALHSELQAVHSEIVETTVGEMSEDDQRELERLLRIVEANLTQASS